MPATKKRDYDSLPRTLIVLREKTPVEGQSPVYVIPELLDLAQNLYFEATKLKAKEKNPLEDSTFMQYVAKAHKEGFIDDTEAEQLKSDYLALSNPLIGLFPFKSAEDALLYYMHLSNRMAKAGMPPPMPQSKKHLCRTLSDPKWEDKWAVCTTENESRFNPAIETLYPKSASYKLVLLKWMIALFASAGTAAGIFFTFGAAAIPAAIAAFVAFQIHFLEKVNSNDSFYALVARNIARTFSGLYHHNRQISLRDTFFTLILGGGAIFVASQGIQALIAKNAAMFGAVAVGALVGISNFANTLRSLLDGTRKLLERYVGWFQFGFRELTVDARLEAKNIQANFHFAYHPSKTQGDLEKPDEKLVQHRALLKKAASYNQKYLTAYETGNMKQTVPPLSKQEDVDLLVQPAPMITHVLDAYTPRHHRQPPLTANHALGISPALNA